MTPEDFYREQEKIYQAGLKKARDRRNAVTGLKLFSFAAVCLSIYWFAVGQSLLFLLSAVFFLFLFILGTILDYRIVKGIREYEMLVDACRKELDYLGGKTGVFPKGEEYLKNDHPYAGDLDILGENSLFQHLNRTVTAGGTDRLAEWLLSPAGTGEEILTRQEAVADLAARADWCLKFRAKGCIYGITGQQLQEMKAWYLEPSFFSGSVKKIPVYIFNGITLILWGLVIFSVIPYTWALIASFLQLGYMSFYLKKINLYYKRLGDFIRMSSGYLYLIQWIGKEEFHSGRINELKKILLDREHNSLDAFLRLKRLLNGFDQRNNMLVGVIRNGLYMSDFHFLMKLDKWKRLHAGWLDEWISVVNEMDALVSMATYRFNHPDFTVPRLKEDCWLCAREMGHPMLVRDKCVKNDFNVEDIHHFYVITGANMAGKSTFLRTVGVNLVLALSGNVVCAAEFRFSLMGLFTSMRTTDNLSRGTSYFHAELLRLKQLTELAGRSERLFIILDEMLKGTNSQDKLNGSFRFLERLRDYRVSGIIATHDLQLGELAQRYPACFYNYCFEITHTADDIVYDYRLKEGVSRNMNASILLEKMGLI